MAGVPKRHPTFTRIRRETERILFTAAYWNVIADSFHVSWNDCQIVLRYRYDNTRCDAANSYEGIVATIVVQRSGTRDISTPACCRAKSSDLHRVSFLLKGTHRNYSQAF